MYKYTIARQLAAKSVITNKGDEVGQIVDLLVNERSGDIDRIIIEVDKTSRLSKKLKGKEKNIEVPYSAVTAVSDVFIVDERAIEIE